MVLSVYIFSQIKGCIGQSIFQDLITDKQLPTNRISTNSIFLAFDYRKLSETSNFNTYLPMPVFLEIFLINNLCTDYKKFCAIIVI